jgi:DNA-binding Xre family transcriptional regulator
MPRLISELSGSTAMIPAPDETASPLDSLVMPKSADLVKQEVKTSIQKQYFDAAEKGQISYLKAWRIMRGFDQTTLAARAGMTQPEISRAERPGQALKMKGETLLRIAQALNVRIEDLLR